MTFSISNFDGVIPRTRESLRRGTTVARAFVATCCAVLALSASAMERYPTHPVRMVVGWPAGGYTDVLARALAHRLSERWKQQVVIDNRPGASEIIGASSVAAAAPDGYTLFLATDQALQANEYLYTKLPYNPARSFTPIIRVATAPPALLVRADSPYRTLNELVEAAKKAPGKLTYGSNGQGSQGHVIINWFALKAGVDFTHIPYKGGAPSLLALMAGEVDMVPIGLGSVDLKASKLRALAVTSAARISTMPELPTFVESGYDVDVQVVFGLVGPAGINPDLAAMIARDVREILADPVFSKEQIERYGNFVVADSPKEFADFLVKDAPRVRARITAANVKLD